MNSPLNLILSQQRSAELQDAAKAARLAASVGSSQHARPIRIRPIEPSDREAQAALFERLGPRSRRRRFLIAKKVLTATELSYFTEVDHLSHEALVAIDQADDSIVGVSRYAAIPARAGTAELAIEVADDAQNQGIGTALLAPTLQRAGESGFVLLAATTHADNWPARALLRRYGFRVNERNGEQLHFELALEQALRRSC